jgi:glycosyltransferase involved in cell wall biosynthesis
MQYNYITNLPLSIKSGGWSGMNVNIHDQLIKHFEVTHYASINPKVHKIEQIKSKLKGQIGRKRDFEFFSERRLKQIAHQYNTQPGINSDFAFFHGTTPWVKCKPSIPYFAYVDATFLTYLDIYLQASNFSAKEIKRIVKQETSFLDNANGIFFSSDWAKQETIHRYELDGDNFYCAGLGGNAVPSSNAVSPKTPSLLFVSMDFKRKGGHIAFQSFLALKKQFRGLTMQIIGDSPSLDIINTEGIIYHGFIDKKSKEGQQQFDNIFKSASFLIHPTEKDMTPLIIVEAGYYGIPAIAPQRFGIPEMIKDGETGYLVASNSVDEYIDKLSTILNQEESLRKMKKQVYQQMCNLFTWVKVGERMALIIKKTFNQ